MRSRPTALILGLAAALALGAPARAGTHDVTTVALGWQTETADAIVVASLADGVAAAGPDGSDSVVELRIDRTLKGEPTAGASIEVRFDTHGRGSPWHSGKPHLLFLRRVAASPDAPAGAFAPLSGEFSIRALDDGSAEARFPSLVADMRTALASADPAALRSLLIAWMDDADAGIAWSAATDFVRHTELHDALPQADAARLLAAFRRAPSKKSAKGALALAVAAARPAGAAEALADSLLAPGAEAAAVRSPVAEALRRLDDPATSALLGTRLTGATSSATRSALLGALATVGRADAVPAVRQLLADADPAVRVESAAALGSIARNVRAADTEARLGLAGVLAARVSGAARSVTAGLPADEARALLWSLAQLDEPRAFDALRTAAADDALPAALREWATRLLARPRQVLVLGG